MKNHLPIVIIILLGCTFCQPDIEPEVNIFIEGTWVQASTIYKTDHVLRKEIIFNNDGTYELAGKIIDTITKEEIEYFYLYTGRYEINGNRLKRLMVDEYGRRDVSHKYRREELILKNTVEELPIVLLSLDENGEVLTFDYRSGDCLNMSIKNCIEVESYLKEK